MSGSSRRGFLKALGLGGAAVAVTKPGKVEAERPTPVARFRTIDAGTGEPIQGVRVYAQWEDLWQIGEHEPALIWGETEEDGVAEVELPRQEHPREIRLHARLWDRKGRRYYHSVAQVVTATPNDGVEMVVQMRPEDVEE